jgi:chromosome segregation ATPase
MKATGAGDQDETVRQLQEEITEQLAELDEENQRLSDRIVLEEKQFEEKLREKDDIIMDLEDMMEEVQRTLEVGGSGAHTTTLLKELGEHKKRIRSAGKLQEELSEALAQIQEKQSKIEELEEILKQLNEEPLNQNTEESLVKEARTMQLEEELAAAKTELEEKSSGNYVTRLKNEIKTLKEVHKDMKNKLKREEQDSKAKLKKKDDAVSFMQNEMIKMRRDLDKFEKKEKKRAASKDKMAIGGGDLQQQIEDLEDEIDHWKAVNFELEDEVGIWKSEANELKKKMNNGINVKEDDDADEEVSLGSIRSFESRASSISKMSKHSHHSLSSITQNDLFFVSDATSVTNIPAPPPDEPSTPSQRAMRSLGGIWSKMTEKPPTRTNSAIPYTMNLDD